MNTRIVSAAKTVETDESASEKRAVDKPKCDICAVAHCCDNFRRM